MESSHEFTQPSKFRRVECTDKELVLNFHGGVLRVTPENANLIRSFIDEDDEKAEEVAALGGGFLNTPVHASQEAVDLFQRLWTMPPDEAAKLIRLMDLRARTTRELMAVADFMNVQHICQQLHHRFDLATRFVDSELMGGPCSITHDSTLSTYLGRPSSMIALPGGFLAVGTKYFGNIHILNARTLDCVRTLTGHMESVLVMIVLPDGTLVSGSVDETINMWNTTTGELICTLGHHDGDVTCLTMFPDGRLASGGLDGSIKVWNVASRSWIETFKQASGPIRRLAVLNDQQIVSLDMNHVLRVISLKGTPDKVLDCITSDLVMVGNGKFASRCRTPDFRSKIKCWDSASWRARTILDVTEDILGLVVLSNGQLGASLGNGTLHMFDTSSNPPVRLAVLQFPSCSQILAQLDDGQLAFASTTGSIEVMDCATLSTIRKIHPHTGGIKLLSVLPNGNVLSGSLEPQPVFKLWDPSTNQLITTFDRRGAYVLLGSYLEPFLGLPDGSVVYALNVDRLCMQSALEIQDRHLVGLGDPNCSTFLPDGRLVFGYADSEIRIWNLTTGVRTSTLNQGGSKVYSVVALNENTLVAGLDEKIKLWNTTTNECSGTLIGHSAAVLCLAVVDENVLASGSVDLRIKIWNASTQKCTGTLVGHETIVLCLVAFCDGRLASGDYFGYIRVWDILGERCMTVIKAHSVGVSRLALLNDGRLISGSDDKSIKVWSRPVACPESRQRFLKSVGLGFDVVRKIVAT